MFRYFLRALFIVPLISFSFFALAEIKTIDNSGFAPGNLWFSKTPSVPGETVRVYSLIWNSSTDDISGTVSFFDNDILIGKQSFVLTGGGTTKIVSVPWKVTEGYNKIYAQITESSGGPRGATASSVSLEFGKSEEEEQFVNATVSKTGSATSTAVNYVSQKVEMAKDYASANLPESVTGTAKTTGNFLEKARESASLWSDNTVKGLKDDLDAKVTAQKSWVSSSDSGFSVERPLKYAGLFIVSIGAFIFANKWLFYILLVLAVFFTLRFIKRKFFF